MKKSKILTSLAGLSTLSMVVMPAIASCGCSNTKYTVELTSKLKERALNSNTKGTSYSFKLANEDIAKATKVKLINLYVNGIEVQTVTGLIKYAYDSAGNIKVVVNTNILLTQWPAGTKFQFSLLFTNKTTNETATITDFILNIDEQVQTIDFESCDWTELAQTVEAYYDGSLSETDFAKLFSYQGQAFASLADFVGKEKEITLYTQVHKVIVIGTNHDAIVSESNNAPQTAILTFQLANLLTDDTGTPLQQFWNSSGDNFSFPSATLNTTLNEATSATQRFWKDGGTTPVDIVSPYYELNQFLGDGLIKKVTKKVATSTDSGLTYQSTDYQCYLFPLSMTEMNQTTNPSEGTAYVYWNDSSHSNKMHGCADGDTNFCPYYLRSPGCTNSTDAYFVGADGSYKNLQSQWGGVGMDNFYVIFGFCI